MKGPLHYFKKNSGLNMSRRSLIGSPARTTLKDVGNLRVNDDQAEKAARRMSVYPIKGGLGDKDAPTTPFKSPFELGAHLNLPVPPLVPQQKCCPRRVSVIFKRIASSFRTKTCVLLSFFILSFGQSLQLVKFRHLHLGYLIFDLLMPHAT